MLSCIKSRTLIPSVHSKCCYFAGELSDADATKKDVGKFRNRPGILHVHVCPTKNCVTVYQKAVQSPLLLLSVLASCCDFDFSLQTNYTQDKMRKKQKEAENTQQDD